MNGGLRNGSQAGVANATPVVTGYSAARSENLRMAV